MNYNILINQFAGEKYFPTLDIIDLAIFDYLKNFYPTSNKYSDTLGVWFWVSHTKLIKDMPKLKIKSKAGIIKRINNLIDYSIIERHPNSKNLGKSYYKIGSKWDLLIKDDTSQQELLGGVDENKEVPNNENQDNNSTIEDPCTKDHILTWRNDFKTYKKELHKVYTNLINDSEYIREQEQFYYNVDIKLSLKKACVNFWGTEAGWGYKKKKKIDNIDWIGTLTNAIDKNKVYKGPQNQTYLPSAKKPRDLENYGRTDK